MKRAALAAGILAALIAFSLSAASGVSMLRQAIFRALGVGAVDRTAESKLRDTVSVKDFGAVGDGVADDTTPVTNARAAAGAAGTVVFPCPGTYHTTLPEGDIPCGIEQGRLRVTTGVINNGGGLKHIRALGCATAAAAGATCTTTLTFTTVFPNIFYSPVCVGVGITSGVPLNGGVTAAVAASITFQTVAATAAAAQYTAIACVAFYDGT